MESTENMVSMAEKDRINKSKNKRRILAAAKMIIVLFHMVVFGGVWFSYYNLFIFRSGNLPGAVITMLLYYIIYDSLARLYKAYKVGQYSIGEIIFSQVLSFGITDLIFYVECCLIARKYVDITRGLAAVAVQLCGVILWTLLAKRYYMHHVKAPATVIIYGKDDVNIFSSKLEKKFSHLFDIKRIMSETEEKETIYKAVDESEVVILYRVGYRKRSAVMRYCVDRMKTFYITPRVPDIIMEGFENRHMIDTPLMKYEYTMDSLRRNIPKRLLDIAVSLFGLIVTLPLTLVTMAAIKLEDGGDIFFRQERYTKDWKKFNILKFRSMVMDAEKDGAMLCTQGDNRITKVGAVIRRFRIDEIPQLINVLKGDMSLVGPRPERVENMEAYTKDLPQFAYRLRVKGGLTGYAQLYGKYNTSANDKLKLDLIYIENQSFLMDLKLLMLTLKILFIPESTEGFSEESVESMKNSNDKYIVQ